MPQFCPEQLQTLISSAVCGEMQQAQRLAGIGGGVICLRWMEAFPPLVAKEGCWEWHYRGGSW